MVLPELKSETFRGVTPPNTKFHAFGHSSRCPPAQQARCFYFLLYSPATHLRDPSLSFFPAQPAPGVVCETLSPRLGATLWAFIPDAVPIPIDLWPFMRPCFSPTLKAHSPYHILRGIDSPTSQLQLRPSQQVPALPPVDLPIGKSRNDSSSLLLLTERPPSAAPHRISEHAFFALPFPSPASNSLENWSPLYLFILLLFILLQSSTGIFRHPPSLRFPV